MMAWLGTALKSSQPKRSASCRSESWIVRMTGPGDAVLPNHRRHRSRFGEGLHCRDANMAAQTRARYSATIWPPARLIRNFVLHWQLHLRWLRFAAIRSGAAASQQKCCSIPVTRFSNSLGANDEYFRENHGRDLRHQGRSRAGRRRYGHEHWIVFWIGGA